MIYTYLNTKFSVQLFFFFDDLLLEFPTYLQDFEDIYRILRMVHFPTVDDNSVRVVYHFSEDATATYRDWYNCLVEKLVSFRLY